MRPPPPGCRGSSRDLRRAGEAHEACLGSPVAPLPPPGRARAPARSGGRGSPPGRRAGPPRSRSTQLAAATCFSARGERGICWYATSRTSTCQNENSSSPRDRRDPHGPDELAARELAQVAPRRRRAVDRAIAATAPSQNTLPTTDASWSSALSSGASVSSRAAIERLHGLREPRGSRRLRARPASARTARHRAGSHPPARGAPSGSRRAGPSARAAAATSRAVPRPPRAETARSSSQLRLPPPQPRLALEELGSRGHDDHSGGYGRAPVEQVLDELEERAVRPVEVLEDEDARPPSGHRLQEPPPGRERLLPADAAPSLPARRRAARASRRATHARTRRRRAPRRLVQLSSASAVRSSDSRIPASAFTISPSAQNVMPSPYGRQRPWRQRDRDPAGRRSPRGAP